MLIVAKAKRFRWLSDLGRHRKVEVDLDIVPIFFQKYRFRIEVTSPMDLPSYKGSTIRGALANSFRACVCLMAGNDCRDCPISGSCAYYRLFEKQIGAASPRAYIIHPPLTRQNLFSAGEHLEFAISLIGNYTNYWNLLIYAVDRVGKGPGLGQHVDGHRGKFRLLSVDALTDTGQTSTVYSSPHGFTGCYPQMLTTQHINHNLRPAPGQIDLELQTPLCLLETTTGLKNKGKRLITDPDYPMLLYSLIHRLRLLSRLYCLEDDDLPYLPLPSWAQLGLIINNATTVVKFPRCSRRQPHAYPVQGILGTLRLQGDLTPFWPYLHLGQWLHIGRQTTFGLGQFRLMEVTECVLPKSQPH